MCRAGNTGTILKNKFITEKLPTVSSVTIWTKQKQYRTKIESVESEKITEIPVL